MSFSRVVHTGLAAAATLIGLISVAEAQRLPIGGVGPRISVSPQPKILLGETYPAAGLKKKAATRVVPVKPVVSTKPVRNVGQAKQPPTKVGNNGTVRRPGLTPDKPTKPGGTIGKAPTTPPGNTSPPGNTKPPRDPKPPVIVKIPPIVVPPIGGRPPSGRPPDSIPPVLTFVPPLLPPTAPPPPPSFLPPLPPMTSGPPPSLQSLDTFVPDEVLITVSSTAPQSLEDDVAQAFNVVILERTPLPLIDARLVRLRIPDSRTVPAVVAAIGADARISLAQPNFLYRPGSDPIGRVQPAAVLGSGIQAGLQYALAAVNVAGAQRLAPNQGRGARIAVLDSGVDRSHPDFAAAKIDEFDAFAGEQKSADDVDRHGTGIAGIIAARGTVMGIAPAVDVLSARVFRARSGQGATATTQHILKGMTWSAERGARVLNMSFAGPRDSLVERHIGAVVVKGLILIAAAGNGGPDATPAYPAAYDKVIAVTAIDAGGKLYEKANRGGYVAIAAPGVDVIVPGADRSHEFQSGTSYAAAHVSGIVALMLEVNPELTPDATRDLLGRASRDLGKPGRDEQFGYGQVDAERAVQLALESRTR